MDTQKYTDKQKTIMGLCMHPACEALGTEWHHVIFRSQSRKKAVMESWNGVKLCAFHHKLGAESPHRSRMWREHYYKYLPPDWKRRIEDCREVR